MSLTLVKSIPRKVKGRFGKFRRGGRSSPGNVGSEGTGIEDARQSQPPPSRAFPNMTSRSTCLDLSEHVLRALSISAQSSPVPYLASVSQVALGILTAVQGAKENQEVLAELAKTACDLASLVLNTYQEPHPANPASTTTQEQPSFSTDSTLNSHVDQLVETFEKINDWITGVISRKLAFRLVSYKSDLRKLKKFRKQLRDAMDKFQLQAAITLRTNVSQTEKNNITRHEQTQERLTTIHENVQIIMLMDSFDHPCFGVTDITPSLTNNMDSGTVDAPELATANTSQLLANDNSLDPGSIQGDIPDHKIIKDHDHTFKSYILDRLIRKIFGNVFNGQNMNFEGEGGGALSFEKTHSILLLM
ncbi:hypothetical protein FB446DRAFT_768994 [Lentinula raphanica]|nr:hypothetical protein FB446DRAFT_768994 [Lentinula raphanica]